jgi:hypothetical protein
MKAYETDVFAEYSADAFNIILGSGDESDDSYS